MADLPLGCFPPHVGVEPPKDPKFGDVWYDTQTLWVFHNSWIKAIREHETLAGGTWEENVEYLLSRCPYTVRVREGGGPENMIDSLICTFMKMEMEIAKLKGNKP